MRFRAIEVAAATGGRLVGPDVELDGVSFDSRSVLPGQLFVPLVAERDGHEFVPDALARGAAAFLTSRPADGTATAIEVDDTLGALMDLARVMRQERFAGPVVGITGSVGKTSTKDLAVAAIGASRPVHANERSFNNDQGLPTTILTTPVDATVLLVEMGMRGPGEIARLCGIAAPQIGVVTRVAEAHGDLVGGIDGVARAKGELVEALPRGGTAILNADDARVVAMAARTTATVLTYGEAADADVRVERITLDELARPSFTAVTPWGDVAVRLGVSGRHMVANAAAALAIAGTVGADVEAAAGALATAGLSPMRMQLVTHRLGWGDRRGLLQRQPDVDARRPRRAGRPAGHAPPGAARADGRDQRQPGRAPRHPGRGRGAGHRGARRRHRPVRHRPRRRPGRGDRRASRR